VLALVGCSRWRFVALGDFTDALALTMMGNTRATGRRSGAKMHHKKRP